MIAYKKKKLDNLLIRKDLEIAFSKKYITMEEKVILRNLYPVEFYSPNHFIRIGLFILTFILVFFSVALALAVTNSSTEKSVGIIFILFSFLTYISLELIIKYKKQYQSGVDDALVWLSGIGFIAGLNLLINLTAIINAAITLVIARYFLLRFTYSLMSVIFVFSFLIFFFLLCINMGGFLQSMVSFLVAIIAAIIYFISKKMHKIERLKYYQHGFLLMEITCLICTYLVVNFYFIKEQPISILRNSFNAVKDVKLSWLYWLLTIAVPLIYIFKSLQKKDRILLRVGMLLIPAIIFTIRYYHAIIAIEFAMVCGGLMLIGLAYALIKYLQKPKYGFTYEEIINEKMIDNLNIEALIIAESFSGAASVDQPADNKTFGGGNFGGGGASGKF